MRAYVYVADDAGFPYGNQPETVLIARIIDVIGQAIAEHAPDLVVVACNTASTLALAELARAFCRALCRHRAGDQAGLRAIADQAHRGAGHAGDRRRANIPAR